MAVRIILEAAAASRPIGKFDNGTAQSPIDVPHAIPPGLDIRLQVCRARQLRRLRQELFGDLYSGPAWDILLHLFESYVHQRRDTVGGIKNGVNLPLATTVRWIDRLAIEGLASTHADFRDARRRFVELSHSGIAVMTMYFSGAAPHLIAA